MTGLSYPFLILQYYPVTEIMKSCFGECLQNATLRLASLYGTNSKVKIKSRSMQKPHVLSEKECRGKLRLPRTQIGKRAV